MEPYTSNEASQLLNIHYNHPEHLINLSDKEVKHLELCVIDDWSNLSIAYIRMFMYSDKLKVLSCMSNKERYFR